MFYASRQATSADTLRTLPAAPTAPEKPAKATEAQQATRTSSGQQRAQGVSVERVRQIRSAALKKLRDDATLRANAAADVPLDLCTPYYAHVTVAAFHTTHTSATEKAVLWRLDHEERMKRERDRLRRLEAALSRDPREATGAGSTPV